MIGATVIKKPTFLQEFIIGLDALAERHFPVSDVLTYLNTTPFQEAWLGPYVFFSQKNIPAICFISYQGTRFFCTLVRFPSVICLIKTSS